MLPIPETRRLVEQRPLDPGVPPAQRSGERGVVEVRRRAGHGRCAPPAPGRRPRTRRPSARRTARRRCAGPRSAARGRRRRTAAGPAGGSRRGRRGAARAAGRSCPGGPAAPRRRRVGSHRYLPRRRAACRVRPSRPAASPAAPSGCRRTARGCSTSTSATVRPATQRSRPRRTTSTSGSSGTGTSTGSGCAAGRRPALSRRSPRRPARPPSCCGRRRGRAPGRRRAPRR